VCRVYYTVWSYTLNMNCRGWGDSRSP